MAEYGETDQLRQRHAQFYCQFEVGQAERLEGNEEVDAYRLGRRAGQPAGGCHLCRRTSDIDLALRLVSHSPSPGLQLGFALYLPLSAIIDLPGATSHDLYPFRISDLG